MVCYLGSAKASRGTIHLSWVVAQVGVSRALFSPTVTTLVKADTSGTQARHRAGRAGVAGFPPPPPHYGVPGQKSDEN